MTLTPQQMPALRGLVRGGRPAFTYGGGSILDSRLRILGSDDGSELRHGLRSTRIPDGTLDNAYRSEMGRVEDLYWVTSDMAAVAKTAAAGVDALQVSMLPVSGIIGVEGLELPLYRGTPETAIIAVTWSKVRVDLRDSGRAIGILSMGLVIEEAGPVSPIHIYLDGGGRVDLDAEQGDNPEGIYGATQVWKWLQAAWELMNTPTVAEAKPMPVPAKVAKKRAKKGRVDPEVRIVTLRPMRNENVTHSPSGRKYHHRWLVRGHWRNQACGPKQSERKRTWVPSYTKGPDGAPLIGGDLVKVWKR